MNITQTHQESRTRDRVRRAVGLGGPITASALAKELGLTPAAVRRHLDALEEAGLIVEHEQQAGARRGRGRPARAFVLTASGQEQFRSDYDGIATAALHFLAREVGEHAVEEFATQQVAELEGRLQTAMRRAMADAEDDDVLSRTDALAAALTAEGFVASSRPVETGAGLVGIQLCQGHCPIRSVASEFRDFCDAETDAISRLLGVHVQRLATLAGGEHVCTTFVPTGALLLGDPAGEQVHLPPDPHAPPYVLPRDA